MKKSNTKSEKSKGCITITYGDCAENHVGMEKLGKLRESGLSHEELHAVANKYGKAAAVEIVELGDGNGQCEKACVLIIRDGVNLLLGEKDAADKLFLEQTNLKWDTKAKMYGRVVNKKARHNLCYAHNGQSADFEKGKGTIVAFSQVPILDKLRSAIHETFGEKAKDLLAEGNYYYDASDCGIGFHGDAERRIVIAVRLGESIPLEYQWFQNGAAFGDRISLTLNHGDIYAMSSKAVGFDWKQKKIPTLRHAAGAKKYLKLKTK